MRETGVNALTTETSLSLTSLEKPVPSALKKDAAKSLNQDWMIPNELFVPAVALRIKISLSKKIFGKSCMSKTSTRVLLTSRKHKTGSLVKSFGECHGGTVLMAACYRPSSHRIPSQKFVSVSAELNHNRSQWVLDSNKGVCCHHSSAWPIWIG